MKKTPEGYVKSAVIEYLQLRKVFFLRLNSGRMMMSSNGKKYSVALAEEGTADLLIFPKVLCDWPCTQVNTKPVWLEVKAPDGKQSAAQKEFQQKRQADGHLYFVVRSVDDVKELGL